MYTFTEVLLCSCSSLSSSALDLSDEGCMQHARGPLNSACYGNCLYLFATDDLPV